jgi:regulator of protease activity HflC (stomatin/prohibitin superfamily)
MSSLWLLAAVAAALIALLLLARVTVFEYQRGLVYKKGRFAKILAPGQYLIYRPWTTVRLVDARRRFVTVSGQEVVAADGVTLKVSLAVSFEVVDPAKAVNQVDNYESAFYLAMQIAARSVIGSVSVDDLIEKRLDIAARLTEAAETPVGELGLRLISAEIKDIMLPGETRRAFAQVVKARKEGQAALELARGETAALRNLANIASVLESHPALLQLRALQQLAASPNNTLVMGMPEGTSVLPARGKTTRPPESPEQVGEVPDDISP